jgi:hypothetical protein
LYKHNRLIEQFLSTHEELAKIKLERNDALLERDNARLDRDAARALLELKTSEFEKALAARDEQHQKQSP